jgi:hypothetical protein
MKKIAETTGEIIKEGKDSNYRDKVVITVMEDKDDYDYLEFVIDGQSVFIDKQELQDITDMFC